MEQFISGVWQNTPVWVWPLFLVLVLLGTLAMRPRRTSVIPFFFFPLFGLVAVNSISGLAHVPTNWIVFALGYLAGAAAAFRWQDTLIEQKSGRTVHLRGDRITILIFLTVFFSNFANGVIEAVAPQMMQAPAFTVIFAAVIGTCCGSFTGRAIRCITLGDRPAVVA